MGATIRNRVILVIVGLTLSLGAIFILQREAPATMNCRNDSHGHWTEWHWEYKREAIDHTRYRSFWKARNYDTGVARRIGIKYCP